MTQPIWNKFCQRFKVNETCVPLFATDGGAVKVRTVGRSDRSVLMRSEECDTKILAETDKQDLLIRGRCSTAAPEENYLEVETQ